MKPKQYNTIKLYYNQFLYKALVRTELANVFGSYHSKNYAKEILDRFALDLELGRPLLLQKWRTVREISKNDFLTAKKLQDLFDEYDDLRIRVDNSYTVSIYTNDYDLINSLENDINVSLREIHRPTSEIADFLKNNLGTSIVRTRMPHDYRVHLNSKRIDPSFANWLTANKDKSQVGDTTLFNIQNGHYVAGSYFYIKNEKILLMIQMLIGHNIAKVERLIYAGDIDK